MIKGFLPDLLTAISDCVQPVSDQCLAKGLIPDSVYRDILESRERNGNKARTLILAVKNCTETDSRCLEILLNILDQQLPCSVKEKLLSEIRKKLTEKANTCRAVIPISQNNVQLVPSEELPRESALLQSSLLGIFEDSIRQHERAYAEKGLLEERLRVKSEECQQIKDELQTMKGQIQESSDKVATAESRITRYESEINNLKAKIEELKKTIEEHGMQARRGRNMVTMVTEKLLIHLAQQTMEEKETAVQYRVKNEARIRYLEHKLETQEKELRIRELEGKPDNSLDADNIIRINCHA